MKTVSVATAALALASPAIGFVHDKRAETLAPSPTNSVGCSPHNDHWHCEGPRTSGPSVTKTLAPSPTNSVGCSPHNDHWHCEGPVTVMTTAAGVSTSTVIGVTTTTHDHDEHEHDETATGTGVLPPSPTGSGVCSPHGDHWHCSGPAATNSNSTQPLSPTMSTPPFNGGASHVQAGASFGLFAIMCLAVGL